MYGGQEVSFIEMELRYGLLQVAEALFYLHTTERLLHLNVCPQNVIVTKRGMWKLSGLCFTQTIGADLPSNVRTVKRQVPWTVSRRTHTRLLCLLTYFSAYLFASPGARSSGSIVVAVCSYFRLESRV